MPKKPPTYRPPGYKSKADYEAQRPNAKQRGYDSCWQRESKLFKLQNPLCVRCKANGVITPTAVVDHIRPHKGDKALFRDRSNWQALCTPCHNSKTAREDGRWG